MTEKAKLRFLAPSAMITEVAKRQLSPCHDAQEVGLWRVFNLVNRIALDPKARGLNPGK